MKYMTRQVTLYVPSTNILVFKFSISGMMAYRGIEHLTHDLVIAGSNPGGVIPNTLKMTPIAFWQTPGIQRMD